MVALEALPSHTALLSPTELTTPRKTNGRATEAEVAKEAEEEWRAEAARSVRERQLLKCELAEEEKMAQWAKNLVLSCHTALLEAQKHQAKREEDMKAAREQLLSQAAGLH